MKILLKFPTRSRPQLAMRALQAYYTMASRPDQIGVAMTCDNDDDSMTRSLVRDEFVRIMGKFEWNRIFYGDSKTKIEACNADIGSVDYPWDIVVLVSDDMIPIVQGYDDVIRTHMMASFPDTNGTVWFNDGYQASNLNTLTIMGRAMHNSIGYIYHPSYKSFYCDTEFTDLCRGPLKERCVYVPSCIIRHEHPGLGYRVFDSLYAKNQGSWLEDMNTYINRKNYPADWTILIATIQGRERSLTALVSAIHTLRQQICPTLRITVTLGYDNRESTIGAKRDRMLQAAEGKYVSFIDDDDMVTAAYFEDAAATVAGNFDCMRLRGQMAQHTFTHSMSHKLLDPMANATTFLRPPNHLNVMKADIAKTVRYRDARNGEDLDWTITMLKQGFLRTEYQSDESRIHYIYNLGDRTVSSAVLQAQQKMTVEDMLPKVFVSGTAPPPKQQSAPAVRALRLGPKGFVHA